MVLLSVFFGGLIVGVVSDVVIRRVFRFLDDYIDRAYVCPFCGRKGA
jgi:prepilin signal peptidase PulO-like enzyme (type II secretory pathway)